MKFKFHLAPVMSAVVAVSAAAVDLQTVEEAGNKIYPDASLSPADFTIPSTDFAQLKREFDVPAFRPNVKAWRTQEGDWLFLDQVYGLADIVSYMVGINQAGEIVGLEILTCAEGFCDNLFTVEWRAQLSEARVGKWRPRDRVPIISGSTMSTTHVADGVKKMLAIHAAYLPGQN
ncbi:FMN-binding protein [Parahaliea maris]|uniref:FMN-binding protein n=1 Tax=Parahaliea maris TaxID=2716870 RepID=A0A5C8ZXM2_9GAMM|nr:FMN-binding protein [Parahaliea maris]TXS91971.1 FMN-binding protein [Parahaliea maris]